MKLTRAAFAAIAVAAIWSSFAPPLSAAVNTFLAADPGAGPANPRPNSNAAAASFDAAAGALGPIGLINLESAPLGDFASLAIGPGVTAKLTGTDPGGGIRTTPTYFGGFNPTVLGYNTTAAGQRFLGVAPIFDIGTTRLTFDFNQAIQAFGAYVSGLEGFNSNLFVLFNDGSNQTIPVSGSANGGVSFVGFTDPGAKIVQVAMELRNVSGARDIFAVDDIRYVAVPEPSSIVLAICCAAVGLVGRRRRLMHPV